MSSINNSLKRKLENEFSRQYGLPLKCPSKDTGKCHDKITELSEQCRNSVELHINDIYKCDYEFIRNFRIKKHGKAKNPHLEACCYVRQYWDCLDVIDVSALNLNIKLPY